MKPRAKTGPLKKPGHGNILKPTRIGNCFITAVSPAAVLRPARKNLSCHLPCINIIASLKPDTGRCAILFPHGVLFRNEEAAMREKLVAHDVVECVLGLGPNLFYNSPMEACVVICRMNKPKERRNRILFINAVNEVTRERAQSFLTDEHITNIVNAYRGFTDIDGFARVINTDEIRQQGNNLSIPLYVRPTVNADRVAESSAQYSTGSLHEVIAAWQKSSQELRQSVDTLFTTLEHTSSTIPMR